jgi:hypothetical protein
MAYSPPVSAAPVPMQCQQFFDILGRFSIVLAVKLYRLQPDTPPRVPTLPCLDHEAMLHEGIAPHAAAYIRDASNYLHEIVFVPDERRVYVDVVSTMGEGTPESHQELMATLRTAFPGYRVGVVGPSWLQGDRRVVSACRAQVTLREVLSGDNLDRTKAAIDRLQTISSLMEKESRVASWGARTVMTPLLAVAGFLTYQIVGTFSPELGPEYVALLRYGIVGLLGAFFLYYGLKAVHLTRMANRVWKRAAEYALILNERRRLTLKA